jgi:hypothetical protein
VINNNSRIFFGKLRSSQLILFELAYQRIARRELSPNHYYSLHLTALKSPLAWGCIANNKEQPILAILFFHL